MKFISQEQINVILQAFYNTNVSAKAFDEIKDFFAKLPDEKKDAK